MTAGPWYGPADAAKYALCSVDTIGDALRSGELRGYQRKPGGKWRIHQADLDAWIRGEVMPTPSPADRRRRLQP